MNYRKVIRYLKAGVLVGVIFLFFNNFKSYQEENLNKESEIIFKTEKDASDVENVDTIETNREFAINFKTENNAPGLSEDEQFTYREVESHKTTEDSILSQFTESLTSNKKVEVIEESIVSTKNSPELLYTKESADFIRLTEAGINRLRKQPHELSTSEPYKSRIEKLHENCKNYTNTNIDLSRLIYNDKHKYIMCEVPKAACTSWKRFWWHLSGFEGYKTVEGDKLIIGHGYITTLNKIPIEEAFEKLQDYTTFFVNRRPLQRTVSAHSSKFTDRVKLDGYKNNLGKPAALRYLPEYVHNIKIRDYKSADYKTRIEQSEIYKNLTNEDKTEVMTSLTALNVGELDFNLFTKMVMGQYRKGHPEKVDVHWRNIMDLCNPCAVNYDYIIDFDNLNEDSNKLLDYLQKSDDEKDKIFFGSRKSVIDTNKTDAILNQLPDEELENLVNVFERDLKVLKLDP